MALNIQDLNSTFGMTDQLVFIEEKGLPFIKINNKKASALISIYAGQVLSFQPVDEPEDLIFISDNAYFQQGKAIRGGIPICWPWFGAAPDNAENPAHGFVRNNFWSVLSADIIENGDTKIKLEFADSEASREIWPYAFSLSLEITVGSKLTLELYTRNTGNQPFSITEALHSYFNVGDASQVKVLGLEDTEYLDKTENFIERHQLGAITFSEETDQIHSDIKHELTIDDPIFNRKIRISSSGNHNVVVWNPWSKGAATMKDLANDDYKHFICAEIANASESVKIQPDCDHKLITHYSVFRD